MKKNRIHNTGRTGGRWWDNIRYVLVLSLLAVGMHLTGCDHTFDPLEEGEGVFSIYGVMDLDENVHQFRVKDLNSPVTPQETREIDVTVTLENLDIGEQQVLEDSVIEYTGSFYTHNFFSTMEILPTTRYAIHVEGSDGSISVTTTTPPRTTAELNNVNNSCDEEIIVTFHPVTDPDDFEVEAGFTRHGAVHWVEIGITEQTSSDEWAVSFIPELAFRANSNFLNCASLESDDIHIRYTHYSAGLFENIQSESFNIPGGIGRFGALVTDQITFPIDTGQ